MYCISPLYIPPPPCISPSKIAYNNEEIRGGKRIRRKLERIWRTTKQPSDCLKYRRQCRRVAELLTASRTLYYSQIIHDNEGDQRKLFKTVDKLLHRTPEPQYPICQSTEVLANKFLEFLKIKFSKYTQILATPLSLAKIISLTHHYHLANLNSLRKL